MSENLVEEVKGLYRKADQTRSIHNSIKTKMEFYNRIITLYITVGSATSTLLIFADLDPIYQTCVGYFFASVFIVSLIPSTLKFDTEIVDRTSAVHLWGKWLKDAHNFCSSDFSNFSDEDFKMEQKQIINDYKKVMENTPQIAENDFNKYKQKHLQKVAISKALDESPFKSLKKIKRELAQKDDVNV